MEWVDAMLPMPGKIRFPTRDQLGVARPTWPDPADACQVASWLIKADNPCLYLAKSGRNPESVEALVQLADLLALPVMETMTDRLTSPPRTHSTAPDPRHRMPMSRSSSNRPPPLFRPKGRRARLEERKLKLWEEVEIQVQQVGQRRLLHPRWVAYQFGNLLEPGTILLDDALSNTPYVQAYRDRTEPGTYFKSGGSTGGWGSSATFGAKLAQPERDVVLASGDGYFMFGTPLAGLWAAAHHKAPFLSVVFVNRSYSTGMRSLASHYPDGAAVRTGNYDGGLFDPPPDFAEE
jgi:thiamine pyrophosphate-dependent acetolactate synthase large subunit-like protein